MGEEHELKELDSMGKKTPFYRRGENPTVIPSLSPHNAVLPHQGRGTTARLRGTTVEDHGTTATAAQAGTCLTRGQYYRLRGTTAPPCGTTARQESLSLGRARMK